MATTRPRKVAVAIPNKQTIVTSNAEVKAQIDARIAELGLGKVYDVVLNELCPEGKVYILGDTSTMLY